MFKPYIFTETQFYFVSLYACIYADIDMWLQTDINIDIN